MKLSCLKDNLRLALALVSGVTGKNLNLPILSNVLLKTGKQGLEISATNLEMAIIATVRAKIDVEGSFTVPARTLTDFVNLTSSDRLDLELVGTELVVGAGKTNTKIKGLNSEEFPIIPDPVGGDGYVVSANDIKNTLQATVQSAAKNDIRPELSGVFWKFGSVGEGGLTLAATDSYRLAEKTCALSQASSDRSVIVPGRSAQEILRIMAIVGEAEEKDARFVVSENQMIVNFGPAHIVTRLVSGSYPDYTQIIPKEFTTTVVVPVSDLQKEIKSASLFSTIGVNAVLLEIDPTSGTLKISSTSSQTGEYKSEITAEITGIPNKILLNHHYILDGLAIISTPSVKINIIGHDSPCLLTATKPDGFRYVVMPIRQ